MSKDLKNEIQSNLQQDFNNAADPLLNYSPQQAFAVQSSLIH